MVIKILQCYGGYGELGSEGGCKITGIDASVNE